MLIELPNGEWIDHSQVMGIHLLDDAEFGTRVVVDTPTSASHFFLKFSTSDEAKGWMSDFGARCASASIQAKQYL